MTQSLFEENLGNVDKRLENERRKKGHRRAVGHGS